MPMTHTTKIAKILSLIACALVLGSCFQLGMDEITTEYIPRTQTLHSEPFSVAGDDLVIVTVYGGVLGTDLNPAHFALTRDDQPVSRPLVPVRGGDNHVLFGFEEPLESGHDYRITMEPAAIQRGVALRVQARAVTTGQRVNLGNAVFQNNVIRSVSYGMGMFIAVGDSGSMAYSFDSGASWIPVQSGEGLSGNRFVGTIYDIAASGTEFLAVGANARISFSPNGIRWTGHRLHDNSGYGETNFHGQNIRAATFAPGATGAGRFVIAGDGGRAMFRWDGDHWRQGDGFGSGRRIYAVAWGNTGGHGTIIAVGNHGSVYVADEGIGRMSWQRVSDSTFGAESVRAAAFGNDVFVIGGHGGRMAFSNNGRNWTRVEYSVFGSSGVLGIAFGAGRFVAVGHDGKMAQSVDGENWELIPVSGFNVGEYISSIATDGRGRFVAVGNGYANNVSRIVSWYQSPGILAPPDDGQRPGPGDRPTPPANVWANRWASANVPAGLDGSRIRGIAWDGTRHVAVGEGVVAFSDDGGRMWTEIPVDGIHFRDVVWGYDKFVAVGYRAGSRNGVAVIASSVDGMYWEFVSPGTLVLLQPISGGINLRIDPRVYAVTFAFSFGDTGRYVAIGERGWSAWSDDGVNWNPVWIAPFSVYGQNDINQTATSIATDGSLVVVGGTMGRLASSSNGGETWNWIANGLLDGEFNDILALAYGDGRFIVAGVDGRMRVADRGQIGMASDWRPVRSELFVNINAVVWGGGHYVAVGDSGSVIFSNDGMSWSEAEVPFVFGNNNLYSVTVGPRFVAGGNGRIIYSY